jgi:pimeloyl-ACP methyl ester carboxylesterase
MRTIPRLAFAFAASFLAACAHMTPQPATSPARVVMEEFRVPASDPGIQLYVRNKHPEGMASVAGNKIVLFVHGATYPASTTFDMALNGFSWMDHLARNGYDVYLVDFRGYGFSTRPKEMSEPADRNDPLVRTETAVKDVGSAVDFIRKRRGVDKINILAFSWGSRVGGWYTAQNNEKVNKLVLYAPGWIRTGGTSLTDQGGKATAYRTVSKDAVKGRWLTGVPEAKKADLIPAGWFEAWADATFATDVEGAKRTPPVLRAPNGVVQDNREFWDAGKALYDPTPIRVPTLLVRAEWDVDLPAYMSHALMGKLTNVPYKRFVEIGEGTHSIMLEKNRMQLFQAVQQFLDEDIKPGM